MQFEVINRAVELALEDIESKRIQTKSQLNQQMNDYDKSWISNRV